MAKRRRGRRWRVLLAAGVVLMALVVLLAALVAWQGWSRGETPPPADSTYVKWREARADAAAIPARNLARTSALPAAPGPASAALPTSPSLARTLFLSHPEQLSPALQDQLTTITAAIDAMLGDMAAYEDAASSMTTEEARHRIAAIWVQRFHLTQAIIHGTGKRFWRAATEDGGELVYQLTAFQTRWTAHAASRLAHASWSVAQIDDDLREWQLYDGMLRARRGRWEDPYIFYTETARDVVDLRYASLRQMPLLPAFSGVVQLTFEDQLQRMRERRVHEFFKNKPFPPHPPTINELAPRVRYNPNNPETPIESN